LLCDVAQHPLRAQVDAISSMSFQSLPASVLAYLHRSEQPANSAAVQTAPPIIRSATSAVLILLTDDAAEMSYPRSARICSERRALHSAHQTAPRTVRAAIPSALSAQKKHAAEMARPRGTGAYSARHGPHAADQKASPAVRSTTSCALYFQRDDSAERLCARIARICGERRLWRQHGRLGPARHRHPHSPQMPAVSWQDTALEADTGDSDAQTLAQCEVEHIGPAP